MVMRRIGYRPIEKINCGRKKRHCVECGGIAAHYVVYMDKWWKKGLFLCSKCASKEYSELHSQIQLFS